MQNRGMFILGAVLISFGILFFIGSVFHIDIWALCFPIALIVAGVWVIARPNLSGAGGPSNVVLIGEVNRKGTWVVDDSETWLGVGDINLDLSQAQIPEGSTRLNFYGFVGDIDLRIPKDVGFALQASGMVATCELFGRKVENVFSPVEYVTENYATASRKIMVEATGFVFTIKVR